MSEYWVSKKKYFCKYCDIYIADDAPSRQQHETGLRHKGNVERFIRGIYKAGEKHKKDLEEEKREMRRVEQATAAAFAADVGAGLAKGHTPVASTSAAPKKPATKPSNPFANYSTAQSLGYTDPDAERIAAELELKRSQGIAGEWQVVNLQPPVGSDVHSKESEASPADGAGLKREAEALPDEEDTRAFKLRKKTVTGLGEIYDPGLIPIKIKKKEEVKPEPEPVPVASSSQIKTEPAEPLKWKPTQWKIAGQSTQSNTEGGASTTSDPQVKQEDLSPESVPSKWVKPQWTAPLPDLKQEDRKSIFGHNESDDRDTLQAQSNDEERKPDVKVEEAKVEETPASIPSGSLFKKRKTPAGAGRGRRDI
ncbi:hypothetical protein D9613_000513 [Agrocybe pediades]|uniref:Matrin-type domain-containing protein n=1 Tax=Agrocybe pediades TaxID=84607 RepID=A0A8H4VSR3_9AGAR|nr:hypothetical protein D9613_000513 [Agrocybe pediades]